MLLQMVYNFNIPNKTTDIKRTFAYSRRKLNEQAIIELYRLFSDYISNIVSELFKNNPYQLFGAITDKNERALFYHEIIQLSAFLASSSPCTRLVSSYARISFA